MTCIISFLVGLFLGTSIGFLVVSLVEIKKPGEYFNDIEYHMSDIYGRKPEEDKKIAR